MVTPAAREQAAESGASSILQMYTLKTQRDWTMPMLEPNTIIARPLVTSTFGLAWKTRSTPALPTVTESNVWYCICC